jgi:hypothetical protein
MRIRIIRPATGTLDGSDLTELRVGRVYDLHSSLASYLIVTGFALAEARREERTSDSSAHGAIQHDQ